MGAFKQINDLSKYVTNSGGKDFNLPVTTIKPEHLPERLPVIQPIKAIQKSDYSFVQVAARE
jgi:hypothetical protein